MGVPKRKKSKMKVRQQKATLRCEPVQVTYCSACGEPTLPHRVCKSCGTYKGKQVVTVE